MASISPRFIFSLAISRSVRESLIFRILFSSRPFAKSVANCVCDWLSSATLKLTLLLFPKIPPNISRKTKGKITVKNIANRSLKKRLELILAKTKTVHSLVFMLMIEAPCLLGPKIHPLD